MVICSPCDAWPEIVVGETFWATYEPFGRHQRPCFAQSSASPFRLSHRLPLIARRSRTLLVDAARRVAPHALRETDVSQSFFEQPILNSSCEEPKV
jgi:hypothetical protein